jgi:hypothetical protein
MTTLTKYETARSQIAMIPDVLAFCGATIPDFVVSKGVGLMNIVRLKLATDQEWKEASALHGCVYFIRDTDQERVKVGYSRDVLKRLRALQTGSSGALKLIGLIAGDARVEGFVHRALGRFSVRGEWFSADGVNRWLTDNAKGFPLRRCIAEIVWVDSVLVWWEWDRAVGKHIKHVWDAKSEGWKRIGHVDHANARAGSDAKTPEAPDE